MTALLLDEGMDELDGRDRAGEHDPAPEEPKGHDVSP